MLRDALGALKQFSHYLQSDQVSLTTANLHIDNLKAKLICFKDGDGQFLNDFLKSFNETGTFQNISVMKASGDENKFAQTKAQFYQSLHDNIVQRFPCDVLLRNALVLNSLNWPNDPIELALYGDREVASLCADLGIDSISTCNVLSEYTVFKKTKVAGKLLGQAMQQIETYPLSTAACERGFSQMALCHTKVRNGLSPKRVNSLLMININGPPIAQWNAKRHVISWLKNGHKSALDRPKKVRKADTVTKPLWMLFCQ